MNDVAPPSPPSSKYRPPKSLGREVLAHVFSGLSASPEWVTRQRNGFTWWASGHATRVWAGPPVTLYGLELTRLHAETRFIRGANTGDHYDAVLADLNREAVLAAIVRDEADPSRLMLRSSVFVHREAAEYTGVLLRQAVGLQALQALHTHKFVTSLLHGESDLMPHPKSGMRSTPEKSLASLEAITARAGQRQSAFEGDDLLTLVRIHSRPPCLDSSGDETHFVAEFPFLGESSLIRFTTQDRHERLGSGFRARLTIPVGGSPAECARIVHRLNRCELAEPTCVHFLGSWSHMENGITFTAFYPNFLFVPRLAVDIGWAFTLRARWVAEEVFHDDWKRVPAKSAAERLQLAERPS